MPGAAEIAVESIIVISADAEWRAVRELFPQAEIRLSPFGEWFYPPRREPLQANTLPAHLYFQGGWGKISAAASAQYAIDRWQPRLLINLGTCGGFEGAIERGTVILANRTLVYDIYEQMGDAQAHIDHYATELDLSWLPGKLPPGVRVDCLVSADRDLEPAGLSELRARYGAIAGDWESGAIAWVARRNQVRCLILRGVSDLVSASDGEAYGNLDLFQRSAYAILRRLVDMLPEFISV